MLVLYLDKLTSCELLQDTDSGSNDIRALFIYNKNVTTCINSTFKLGGPTNLQLQSYLQNTNS